MSKNLKLPWIRNRKRSAPELPLKPPIHLGALSNGEVFRPAHRMARKVERLILEKADEGARRHGIDRREFLASSMGMATSLWALNVVSGCGSSGSSGGVGAGGAGAGGFGGTVGGGGAPLGGAAGSGAGGAGPGAGGLVGGGGAGVGGAGAGGGPIQDAGASGGMFNVPDDPTDADVVCEMMLDPSKEFIFDIQTHHVNRADTAYADFLRDQIQYNAYCVPNAIPEVECFGQNEYVRLMFLESDTSVAVLSGLPAATEPGNPITNPEIAQAAEAINMMADGSNRLINHHMVLPNRTGTTPDAVSAELDQMDAVLQMYGRIGAWKSYPAWSPNNTEASATEGFWFTDPVVGIPFVQRGIQLGVPVFCIHKGLPIPGFSTEYNDPGDIGQVAKMFPEAKFIIYHSGFGNQNNYFEGAYAQGALNGVNSLVTSLMNAGLGPGSNVYAELGTTWQLVSTALGIGQAAAHLLGKLLLYVGEDNIVWGTDSIWYGSPQAQIESFLAFQIPANLQAQYGYPDLTMDIKRKILGFNAAAAYGIDPVAMRCAIDSTDLARLRLELDHTWGKRRWTFQTPALRSRQKFFELLRRDNLPG